MLRAIILAAFALLLPVAAQAGGAPQTEIRCVQMHKQGETSSRCQSHFRRLYEKWRCIHEHEGAWNDPNGPYYGGLQMDISFQRAHGWDFYRRWGTADRWPVWAQLVTAERAYRIRGFSPWPNTARTCGLR